MAEKKESAGFTVTDRRLFNSEGELRTETPEEYKPAPKAAAPAPIAEAAPPPTPEEAADRDMPLPPSAAEQEAQAAAYKQSAKDIDARVELSGHSTKDFEVTMERFFAQLYMTAMLQLGLMREQGGQPRIDIIGARQTIDTISLLAEKTKGNLTNAEENFLQNSLYELRMAYVEVTNALSRPPQQPATGTTGPAGKR